MDPRTLRPAQADRRVMRVQVGEGAAARWEAVPVIGAGVSTSQESGSLPAVFPEPLPVPAAGLARLCRVDGALPASSLESQRALRSSATIIWLEHLGQRPCLPAADVASLSMFSHCGHRSLATPGSSCIGLTSASANRANSRQLPNRSPAGLAIPL